MKRIRLLSGLLAGALALTLAACGPREDPEPSISPSALPAPSPSASPEAEPTPTPSPEATPVPAADPVWGEQSFARTFTAGDGTTVLSVNYVLPLVQNTDACPAGTAINDWYKQEGSSRMLEAEEQYEMAVADYDVSQAAGFPFSPTTQEMTYTVAYEDENLISIRRELYVAAEGAAHPSAFLLAETFDAATGEKLGFSRVFTDADTVRERAVDAFVSQYGLEDSRDAVTVAWQPERFYLSAEGYVFWLAGGELPGVNSPIEVTLSYESMEDVSVYG